MRKFSINCDFGGQLAPFDIFIGQPEQGHHPLHFQADWLLKQRGGTILPEVMDAIAKLNTLAVEKGVPLEDLCVYALGAAQDESSTNEEAPAIQDSDTETTDIEQSQTDNTIEEISSQDTPKNEAQHPDQFTDAAAVEEDIKNENEIQTGETDKSDTDFSEAPNSQDSLNDDSSMSEVEEINEDNPSSEQANDKKQEADNKQ